MIDENCEFDNLVDDYLSSSRPSNQRMLLANLTEIEEQSDGCDVLIARYRGEFAPERWELSAEEWVKIVNNRKIEFLHANGHSSELSCG
ncbi:contact-dependent growth inhibition system immunity protein [Pantoea sp. BL1]|uniref:contact-dependent growth inhibition system immunity protein n=1 Tax=Pantoea sp. BL1 TaxID=1628190 RepID=UPI0012E0B81D|nr:contact-dependent growth inhibition system immunity protein [Pantoea sp. BL1]